jgi:hypothetical protein
MVFVGPWLPLPLPARKNELHASGASSRPQRPARSPQLSVGLADEESEGFVVWDFVVVLVVVLADWIVAVMLVLVLLFFPGAARYANALPPRNADC